MFVSSFLHSVFFLRSQQKISFWKASWQVVANTQGTRSEKEMRSEKCKKHHWSSPCREIREIAGERGTVLVAVAAKRLLHLLCPLRSQQLAFARSLTAVLSLVLCRCALFLALFLALCPDLDLFLCCLIPSPQFYLRVRGRECYDSPSSRAACPRERANV